MATARVAALHGFVGGTIEADRQHRARFQKLHAIGVAVDRVGAVDVKQQPVESFVVAGDRTGFELMPEFHLRVSIVFRELERQRLFHER